MKRNFLIAGARVRGWKVEAGMGVDCAIIGGGPAGLNAALVLGRARRSVIVFDDYTPRNAVTVYTHGFMTRDGVKPVELRRLAWRDMERYPSVALVRKRVTEVLPASGSIRMEVGTRLHEGFQAGTVSHPNERFRLKAVDGTVYEARKLLLAAGLKETLPQIPGIQHLYGKSLFNCPYCDGWELRDQPLVVIAEGSNAFSLTRLAYQWSRDLLLCTNGSARSLDYEAIQLLRRKGIAVTGDRIQELVGEGGRLQFIRFEKGSIVRRSGGFVSPYWRQAAPFGELLGCAMNEQGGFQADRLGRTSVYGVYVAGDASIIAPAQAVIAAGEGSRAAIGINADLIQEDF